MKFHVITLLAAILGPAVVAAQGVTEKIAPTATGAAGCEPTIDGKFEIAVVDAGSVQKRDFIEHKKRTACTGNGVLLAELNDGVITDSAGRTGYIASNYQFQFDDPPQAGAIYTAGFSHCPNGSLALGDSAVWYQCRSGNFYNLYDRYWAEQCSPVEILVLPCGGAGAVDNGQRTVGTEMATTTVVIPLADGQPQVVTTTVPIPICQIGDGQIQGHTTPCAALTVPPSSAASVNIPPVSQFSDGQIQVTQKPAPTPSAAGGPLPPTSNDTLQTPGVVPTEPAVVPTRAPGVNSAGRLQVASALLVGVVGIFCLL